MTPFDEAYKKLNKSQKEAVDSIDGPVMIIAGPGTGKTTVLTTRIANILKKTDARPSNILALTFTESGVSAMRNKLIDLIGKDAYYVEIGTFHSFTNDIILNFQEKFAFTKEFQSINDIEKIQVYTQIIDELDLEILRPFKSPYYYLNQIMSSISNLKREGIDPKEYERLIKEDELEFNETKKINPKTGKLRGIDQRFADNITKNKELLEIYKAYLLKIEDIGRYDYEDMIMKVLERMKLDEEFRLNLQERYQYILVDEYQDTNSSQNELVFELASYWGEEANIFVVGDDEQAIFRFQGASLENLLTFRKSYPNAKVIILSQNYRSDQHLIDASQKMIANNDERIEKYIDNLDKSFKSASGKAGKKIQVAEFESGLVEGFFIANDIKAKVDKGANLSDIAILVRNNSDSTDLAYIFDKLGIEHNIQAGENVIEAGVIRRLVNLFKLIRDLQGDTEADPILHFNVLNYEFIDVNKYDVLVLSNIANKTRKSFFETVLQLISEVDTNSKVPEQLQLAVKQVEQNKELSKDFKYLEEPEKLVDFYKKLFYWASANETNTFVHFFEIVIKESGYLSWVLKSENEIENLNDLNSFFDQVKELNYSDKTLDLRKFLDDLKIMEENGIRIEKRDLGIERIGVNVITAHKSKGLEFDYVYLYKTVDKKWGNQRDQDKITLPSGLVKTIKPSKESKLEDERRLFYVALTRARREVIVTYSTKYNEVNGERNTLGSIFVKELPKENLQIMDTKAYVHKNLKAIEELILTEETKSSDNISKKEASYIDNLLSFYKLSPTALNNYINCHYKFKLQNLFRVPAAKSATLSFGSAVHYALEAFFNNYKAYEKLPSFDFLYKRYVKGLEKEVLSEKDQKELLKKGKDILQKYYAEYKDEFRVPLYLEFRFGKGFHKATYENMPLSGVIDKFEPVKGEPKTLRVIDYKTGRAKSKNEIQGLTKNTDGGYYRQLLFYKLLTELDTNFNLEVVQGELDFVEGLKKVEINYDEKDFEDFKIDLKKYIQSIKGHEFERTTDYSKCQNCEFKDHCWPDGVPVRLNSENIPA
ncbi:ATP-dependent helicase [Candidatus Dojkabacteria bacterium]|uniref:DNA 3'-5' helicase n=1 Tax=Candidatus Dojkabacteria bacterium TaxID=2099670 RepID=A0A955L4F6_9BACT|nr:ATP-dependent helicase [Candidatus Dojkabacteria bacterium]